MGERLRHVAAIASLAGIGGVALTGCGANSETSSKTDGISLVRSIEALPLDWGNDPKVSVVGEATVVTLPDGRIVEIDLFTRGTKPLASGAPQPIPSDVTGVDVLILPAGSDYMNIAVETQRGYLFQTGTTNRQGIFNPRGYYASASYQSLAHPKYDMTDQNSYNIQTNDSSLETILPHGAVHTYAATEEQVNRVTSEIEQQALDIAKAISRHGALPELPEIQPN